VSLLAASRRAAAHRLAPCRRSPHVATEAIKSIAPRLGDLRDNNEHENEERGD
jgi:hypothetical protein